jgi:hypothetical protein
LLLAAGDNTTCQANCSPICHLLSCHPSSNNQPQGFSPSLFPLFPAGDPRVNVTGPYGRPVTIIRSPKVAAVARAHFGCAALLGAALEDEGGGGSTGSHWEARLFQGELMLAAAPFAGRVDKLPRLALTMALFEDRWGRRGSCCGDWITVNTDS